MLFSSREVADYINATFEPAWETVRPVPIVTIDFGNGHTVKRTLQGNIATYICDSEGNVYDVLPGIYSPTVYRRELEACSVFVKSLSLKHTATHAIGVDLSIRLRSYHAEQAIRLGAESPALQIQAIAQSGGSFKGGGGNGNLAGSGGGFGGTAQFQGNFGGFQGTSGVGNSVAPGMVFGGISEMQAVAKTGGAGKGGFGGSGAGKGGFGGGQGGFGGGAGKGGFGGGGFQSVGTLGGFQGTVPSGSASALGSGFGGIEGPLAQVISSGLPAPTTATAPPTGPLADWPVLALDSQVNELIRRKSIHEHLAHLNAVRPDDIKKWLFKEVLHADLDDPLLGLGGLLNDHYPFAEEDRSLANSKPVGIP